MTNLKTESVTRVWMNRDGKFVHPNAPAGSGGSGSFRSAAVLNLDYSINIPHPNSPAGRNYQLSKNDVAALVQWIGKGPDPKLPAPLRNQIKQVRDRSKSTLENIQKTMLSLAPNLPGVSKSDEPWLEKAKLQPGKATESAFEEFKESVLSLLGAQTSHYAHLTLEHRLKHFQTLEQKLAPLLEKVLSKIARADIRLKDLDSFFTKLLIPEEKRLGDISEVTKELDAFEKEYVGLMSKIVKQHPSAPELGKFISEHLKGLKLLGEILDWAGPTVEAFFGGFHIGTDLDKGDYHALATDTFLLLLLFFVIAFMPEVFIVLFFAEPFLKFVEASIKQGPPLSQQIAKAAGAKPISTLPTWQEALRRHMAGQPMFTGR
jgi:hypothetical protein